MFEAIEIVRYQLPRAANDERPVGSIVAYTNALAQLARTDVELAEGLAQQLPWVTQLDEPLQLLAAA
jgi:hypothetical protein